MTPVRETLRLFDLNGIQRPILSHHDVKKYFEQMRRDKTIFENKENHRELLELIRSIERVLILRSRAPEEPGFIPKTYLITSPIHPDTPRTAEDVLSGELYVQSNAKAKMPIPIPLPSSEKKRPLDQNEATGVSSN